LSGKASSADASVQAVTARTRARAEKHRFMGELRMICGRSERAIREGPFPETLRTIAALLVDCQLCKASG